MPYVTHATRAVLDGYSLGYCTPETPGELNYAITTLCQNYLDGRGELRYNHINDVIGALECAKQEFYRRIAVPYEDAKIKENGDVY